MAFIVNIMDSTSWKRIKFKYKLGQFSNGTSPSPVNKTNAPTVNPLAPRPPVKLRLLLSSLSSRVNTGFILASF